MTFDDFTAASSEPRLASPALRALWHDRHGNWNTAHDIVMDAADPESAWVHAYLHRKEGDLPNAGYWYRLAGHPVATGSLENEWESIVRDLLST